MPTPVEVSHIKRNVAGIERLGGAWRNRPWNMSVLNVIWEIERQDSNRQWDFFVVIDRANVRITVAKLDGRKHLMAAGKPLTHLGLQEWLGLTPDPV
jgi:hypothetical protein